MYEWNINLRIYISKVKYTWALNWYANLTEYFSRTWTISLNSQRDDESFSSSDSLLIHENFINLIRTYGSLQTVERSAELRAISLENSIYLGSFYPFFTNFSSSRRWEGRGARRRRKKSRIVGVIILPAVSFTSISFPL